MKHHRQSLPVFLSVIVAAMLLGAGEAQAKQGFKLWTVGETISSIGPVKPGIMSEYDAPAGYNQVGFKYDYAGLFWLDFWNWDGQYCVTNGVKYLNPTLSKEEAARLMGTTTASLGKPLNYRIPYGLVIVLGLVGLKFVPRLIMKRRQQQAAGNFDPSRGSTPQQPWTPPAPPSGGPPPIPPPMPPEQ